MATKGDPIVGGTSEKEGKAWGNGSFANMPQEVKMKDYPKRSYHEMPSIDDTSGRLMDDDRYNERGDRRGLDRGMY